MKRLISLLTGAGLTAALCLALPQHAFARPADGWVSTTLDGGGANLRAAPSTNSAIQATAVNGTRFSIVDQQNDQAGYRWYQVRPVSVNPTSPVWIRSDLVSFAAPIAAQPQRSCGEAIAQTEQRLRTFPNTEIRTRTQRPHGYSDGPAGRPDSYSFILTGSGAPSILASPAVMNSMAAQLIENCSEAGLVSFSATPTDSGYANYGWMPGRLVRPFQCRLGTNSDRPPAKWGEQICL